MAGDAVWNHDDFEHRFEALADGIGDRVRATEHRLVDDHRPHGPPPNSFVRSCLIASQVVFASPFTMQA